MDDQDLASTFQRWWERDGHWLYTKSRAFEVWQKRGIEYLPDCTSGTISLLQKWVSEEIPAQKQLLTEQHNPALSGMIGRRVKPFMEPREHGKAIIGRAIVGALDTVEARISARDSDRTPR